MPKSKLLPIAFAAALAAGPGLAQSLATAEIEDCVVSDILECEAKMVATTAVSYGLSARLDFTPDDAAKIPYKVEVEKRQPRIVYPLIYHHSVLYSPVADFDNPDPLIFAGYRIGRPRTSYDVDVSLTAGAFEHFFTLTPENPVYNTRHDPNYTPPGPDDHPAVRVALAGDAALTEDAPDLSNFLLYIPDSPDRHPYVHDYRFNMLLVPREEVSWDGTECDKVGYISLGKGAQKNGVCLDNQLYDKHEADLASLVLNSDIDTRYLLVGMKLFKWSMEFPGDYEKMLVYRPPEIAFTDVALTVEAGSVRRVTPESAGVILEATALLDTFPALSPDGFLRVRIWNTGDQRADFVVSVTDCNFEIERTIPAQARTLQAARGRADLYFPLTAKYNSQNTNECYVTLKAPTGKVYDGPLPVVFDTDTHGTDLQAPPWHLP